MRVTTSYPPWTENHILYWFSLVPRLKQLSWVSYTSLKWVVLTREVYWLPFVPECISLCEIRHLLGAVQTFCSGHTPSVGISRHLRGYKLYYSWLYSVPDTDHLHSGGGGTSHRSTRLRLLHGTNYIDSNLSTPPLADTVHTVFTLSAGRQWCEGRGQLSTM